MNERFVLEGRLVEAKRKFEELDLVAGADIVTVRELIDPYEDDVTKLNVDQARVVMDRIFSTIHEMREVQARIVELKQALGIK